MKEEKRERILDAMEQLMYQMPNQDISVQMIAQKAQIGKGSVYYYFSSKDEILYAVIERSYERVIREYISRTDKTANSFKKIRLLFESILQNEFQDKKINLLHTLHLQENILLHNLMKSVAVHTISPIMEDLLIEGVEEGVIYTETPKESAEMIVAVMTFFLDDKTMQEDPSATKKKMQIFSRVLATCLRAEKGSFDFLWRTEET